MDEPWPMLFDAAAFEKARVSFHSFAKEMAAFGDACGILHAAVGDALEHAMRAVAEPPRSLQREVTPLLYAIDDWLVEATDKRWIPLDVVLHPYPSAGLEVLRVTMGVAGGAQPEMHLDLMSVIPPAEGWTWAGWSRYNLGSIQAAGWVEGSLRTHPPMRLDALLHKLVDEGGWSRRTPRFSKDHSVTGDLEAVRNRFRPMTITIGIDFAAPEPVKERERTWHGGNSISCTCTMPPLQLHEPLQHEMTCPLARTVERAHERDCYCISTLGVSAKVTTLLWDSGSTCEDGVEDTRKRVWATMEHAACLGWIGEVIMIGAIDRATMTVRHWCKTVAGDSFWDEHLEVNGVVTFPMRSDGA